MLINTCTGIESVPEGHADDAVRNRSPRKNNVGRRAGNSHRHRALTGANSLGGGRKLDGNTRRPHYRYGFRQTGATGGSWRYYISYSLRVYAAVSQHLLNGVSRSIRIACGGAVTVHANVVPATFEVSAILVWVDGQIV